MGVARACSGGRGATQIVWDAASVGTATAPDGSPIRVGHAGEWTPERLLALAAASCFMSTFLRMADELGIEILGYVSAADVELPLEPARPTIRLAPCIVISARDDEDAVRRLCHSVIAVSPIVKALGSNVEIELDIRTVPLAFPPGG
jgi:organic hydroperoxide reductase OsmC/OhrA